MSDKGAAFRYAKPIFDLAIEQNLLEAQNEDMHLFAQTIKENPEFAAVLKNPVIRGFKKLRILKGIFEGKVHALSMALIELLTKKDREALLDDIAIAFQEMYDAHKNIQKVDFISTIELDTQEKENLTNLLSKQINKTVVLNTKIDTRLIGGFVLRIGDRQIDHSIRSGLQRLKTKLSV